MANYNEFKLLDNEYGLKYILASTGSVFLSFLFIINQKIALILIPGLIAIIKLLQKPLLCFYIMILLTPVSSTPFFNQQIGGIPGLKIFNIISILTITGFIFSDRKAIINRETNIFYIGIISLFIISVLRSLDAIPILNAHMKLSIGVKGYILSHMIKPLLHLVPLLLITSYIRSKRDINKILLTFVICLLIFAATTLFFYVFFIPNKALYSMVRLMISEYIGFHGNSISSFYIITYPLLLAYAISTRSKLAIASTALSLCTVGILYSRMAYLMIIFATFAFMLVSRRSKNIIYVLIVSFIIALFLPSSILERAVWGIDRGGANNVTAGRTGDIWFPSLKEVSQSPYKILIGSGRYGIIKTKAYIRKQILRVGHAHNMYINIFMDAGIIGLLFFILSFMYFTSYFIKALKYIDDPFYFDIMCGIIVSVTCYLLGGLTDRDFFPTLPNSFLWITLGIGIVIANHYTKERCHVEEDMFCEP